MKRTFCILLALMLALTTLTACDRRSEAPEDADVSFAPEDETSPGGLSDALSATEESDIALPEVTPEAEALPVASDEPTDEGEAELGGEFATVEPSEDADMPFATPTPQPNTAVSEYSQISAPGLGFRFKYPSDWVNIPGRSTVCYVQPLTNGTVYPARVAVSMKRMPHQSYMDEVREQLVSYLRKLEAQYDSETFRVSNNLSKKTKFMGRKALSTTYLAYDGEQEIKGYVIMTYFDRYIFVFHFLCAYDDYEAFTSSMQSMRDSVQADPSVAPK